MVRTAAAALAAGRAWRATEILDSVYPDPRARLPEVALMAATAAATWGGWSRVDSALSGAAWLDSLFDGHGRVLLTRSALARGMDSSARASAESAVRAAKTDSDRGTRLVLLARALDRLAVADSAAATYRRAARLLPSVADWLELRAAGVTADARQRRDSYARLRTDVARARVAPTEAQARERWRDFTGAAAAYAELGQPAAALRLRLLAARDSLAREAIRRDALTLVGSKAAAEDVRGAIAIVDSAGSPLSLGDELTVARGAAAAGLHARAVTGYAGVAGAAPLADADRFSYATALSRLGRDREAAAQFSRVPPGAAMGPEAAYQHARSLLRARQGAAASAALRRVAVTFPRDTAAAAPALFLLADLATDGGRDAEAGRTFRSVAERYPSSPLAAAARFRAAVIAYTGGSFRDAGRELDTLIARHPTSVEVLAAGYWSGRAWDRAGDARQARERWRAVIAREPLSYYSWMSARRLNEPPWRPSAAEADTVAGRAPPALAEAVARAALLDQLGMTTEEGLEYDDIMASATGSPERMLTAAEALRDRGEVSRSVALARRALAAAATRDTRLFRLLYPLAHGEVIRAQAAARRLDPALVAGLIHQESSFNPRAVSRAGAVGLMQVLPAVGRTLARSVGLRGFEPALLYQPEVNVRMGVAHLQAMLDSYPHPAYALAAYNAGGSPVRRWRAKPGTTDPELFIERIPYEETRDYVRILLRNQATYRALYDWQR